MGDAKVYIGDLDPNVEKQEVEEVFGKIGPLRSVWVARKPPGFAFVEFEDPRDAQDAVRDMDGTRLGDKRVRVEISKGRRGGNRGGNRGGYDRDRRSPPRRRSRSRSRSRERFDRHDRDRYDRSRSRTPPRRGSPRY